jgi:hypothetical protein
VQKFVHAAPGTDGQAAEPVVTRTHLVDPNGRHLVGGWYPAAPHYRGSPTSDRSHCSRSSKIGVLAREAWTHAGRVARAAQGENGDKFKES